MRLNDSRRLIPAKWVQLMCGNENK